MQDNIVILTDKDNYKDENNDLLIFDGSFRYIDLMSVDILLYHNSKNELEIKDIIFRKHNFKDTKTTYISLDTDGYYTIVHMELPTKEFMCNASGIDRHRIIYTNGKEFFEHYLGFSDKLSVQDILNLAKDSNNPSNLVFQCVTLEQVTIYNLYNQYIAKVTDNLMSKSKDQTLQIMKSYIDVIEYLCEHHSEVEANRLIHKISNCNNLYDYSINNESGCGCQTKKKVYW